ncbi:MAG: thiamine-phosphate kinase [Gammaproteobacteria bacterium]|nr:MAG: thiamine-phosphate kinase [Gammaproteobacteria bacterium]
MADEFSIIDDYFKPLGEAIASPNVVLGIGDDAALLTGRPGYQLAVSCDTLVAGVHFLADTPPEDIGHKALAVNLSDLAAMGAQPAWFSICLTLPEQNERWIQGLVNGLAVLAKQYQVPLIGGDTTHGPLTLSLQIAGWVPNGEAITRSGAQPGDQIFVAGELGWPYIGLLLLNNTLADTATISKTQTRMARQQLLRPEPQMELGSALRGLATSMLDISDGLSADLMHILKASKVGARLNLAAIPKAAPLTQLAPQQQWDAVNFGDEYKLLFTVPKERIAALQSLQQRLGCSLTAVGEITESRVLTDEHGSTIKAKGYRHF